MEIRRLTEDDRDEWLRLRSRLWPDTPDLVHERQVDGVLSKPDRRVAFGYLHEDGHLGGFVEAGLRNHAEGCETSPVAYLEGWYVEEEYRGRAIGRTLVQRVEAWAREHACAELASDTNQGNLEGQKAHLALGFEEAGRLVHYRRTLDPDAAV